MKTSVISEKTRVRLVGILLLAEVAAVLLPVIVLGKYFEFPDVLRRPAAYGLALFRQDQAHIVPAYYVFMVSGLLFLPLSYAINSVLKTTASAVWQELLTGLGLATAIFQSIGFSRWLFVIPFLADQYAQQPAQRATIALLYETLNRYAGMTIGEHLGFLAMGCWSLVLAALLWQYRLASRWFALAGVPIGVGLLVSVLEHAGGPSAEFLAIINFAANTAWSIWLFLLGCWFLAYAPVYQFVTISGQYPVLR
ncbi:DUF4386 domain-containing protein [Spirosoma linguale]|uniref:DUF4386 domain-containing protein n=1 Tax=Spirosoma linguale (strain ATCC 33905 / DSM 74 / LMG 10896 / Claus 1) TaxID=504472 RepID=D2QS99_SPILD|nr:hypothetical protein Slin_5716 [Spirosoma linguale DSM 74]